MTIVIGHLTDVEVVLVFHELEFVEVFGYLLVLRFKAHNVLLLLH